MFIGTIVAALTGQKLQEGSATKKRLKSKPRIFWAVFLWRESGRAPFEIRSLPARFTHKHPKAIAISAEK